MIAITGGSGFIGRTLVRLLLEKKKKVRLMMRTVPAESDKIPGVEYFPSDLGRASPAALQDFLKGASLLFHLAGMVSRDPEESTRMMDLHVDCTRKILTHARDSGIKRVVLLSTSGTVGISSEPDFIADDDSPYAMELASRWPYYESKIYQEKLSLQWARDYNTELIALRPSLTLGPGDDNFSSTGDVLKFLQKKIPAIPSGGISFVDVRDVAEACMIAGTKSFDDLRGNPRTYLLGAANWTMEKLFRSLETASGVSGPWFKSGPTFSLLSARLLASPINPFRKLVDLDAISVDMANRFWYINATKAEKELGIHFRSPEETLQDTVLYLRRTA